MRVNLPLSALSLVEVALDLADSRLLICVYKGGREGRVACNNAHVGVCGGPRVALRQWGSTSQMRTLRAARGREREACNYSKARGFTDGDAVVFTKRANAEWDGEAMRCIADKVHRGQGVPLLDRRRLAPPSCACDRCVYVPPSCGRC